MLNISVSDLERAFKTVSSHFGNTEGFASEYSPILQKVSAAFNSAALSHCLDKFIGAELDCHTPGDRGLGRISTHIPRLGAYYRRQFSKLGQSDRDELSAHICDIMLSGYLVHAFLLDKGERMAKVTDPHQLYDFWLPGIYSTDPGQLPEQLMEALTHFASPAAGACRQFLASHKCKGGGFMSKDKTQTILLFYVIGGYGLRFIEIRGKGDPETV